MAPIVLGYCASANIKTTLYGDIVITDAEQNIQTLNELNVECNNVKMKIQKMKSMIIGWKNERTKSRISWGI